MPIAIVPTAAHCRVRFTRLLEERKLGLSSWKIAQMTTSPMTTGSEPRLPPRMRARKSVRLVTNAAESREARIRHRWPVPWSGCAVIEAVPSTVALARAGTP